MCACEPPASICYCVAETACEVLCGANADREAHANLCFSVRSRPEGDGEVVIN